MPRYPTRETYAARTCILCRASFRPERWDQSYCGNKCAQVVNRFLAGRPLEFAEALQRQNLLCWMCETERYPRVYPMLIRPWHINNNGGPHLCDYIAVCATCKRPVRMTLALGAYTDTGE